MVRGLATLAALLVLTSVSGPVAGASTGTPPVTTDVQAFMTLYGYVDNAPSGTGIAHPCIHDAAGGTGTYGDPITFATDVAEMPWCTVIYVPYMERYFIHEDECSQCDVNWSQQHLYRFDMWAGGDAGSRQGAEKTALLHCESTWTRAGTVSDPGNPTIVINPPGDLPVTTVPIFSPPTSCWQPITVTDPGNQTASLSLAVRLPIRAADTSPDPTLTYQASGLPVGLSIDPASGVISGTPTARGRSRVIVTASDPFHSATVTFHWVVKSVARNLRNY